MGARISRALRAAVLHRAPGPYCWICGGDFEAGEVPTMDHLRPRSRGGGNTKRNLRVAHAVCNRARGNETVMTKIAALAKQARADELEKRAALSAIDDYFAGLIAERLDRRAGPV